MQKWTNFFDKIFVINLKKRYDRWLHIQKQLKKYSINFERKEAIEHERGAEGLRLTMVEIFNEAISKGWNNVLIFEDDVEVVNKDFDEVMNKVVTQIPNDYLICYLGCNLTTGVSGFYSENLLPVVNAFSTHACFYSRKAIELILKNNFSAPIDNYMVSQVQNRYGNCYCTYPFLCTQIAGISDIENKFVDWNPFLHLRYKQRLSLLNHKP